MNNFDWNDNELVNYWELAKNEYMKYYSISRDSQGSTKSTLDNVVEPSINATTSLDPSIKSITTNTSPANNAKTCPTGTSLDTKTKGNSANQTSVLNTVKTRNESQENNETVHFLFPGKQVDDSTKDIILNQMNEYYTGYKHGLHSTNVLNNLPTNSALFQLGINNSRLFF